MGATAGYVAVSMVFFLLALAATLLVYHYYTKQSVKTMPISCVLCHIIALYMCVLPFPLLVVDVDAALAVRGVDEGTKQTWMRSLWIVIFAVTYTSAWVSLPIAQTYTEVGAFTWRRGLWQSVVLNAKMYIVIVVLLAVLFTYILIAKGAYHSFKSILAIGKSLANAWGLLILILFMPAGLIGVPRMLWRYANPRRLLRRLLFDAMDVQEDLDLAAMDLAAIKNELIGIDPFVSEENRPHLAEMLERIAVADRDVPLYHLAAQRVKATGPPPPTEQADVSLPHLEDLNARLKYSIKLVYRTNHRWVSAVRDCRLLDQTVRGSNNPIKRAWLSVRTYVYWAGCGVCTVLTLLILWSELVLPFQSLTSVPLGVIELVMSSAVHFVASVVLLFYMAYCAYWAVFQFKVFDVYVVYPGIADNASLCFNETFLVRLLMPLCYNFLLISGFTDATRVDVQYGHVYRQDMSVTLLLGENFNRFVPVLIPFVAAIVGFQFAQRVLGLIGVEVKNPNDVESLAVRQRIEDGRKLVEAELGFPLASQLFPGEEPAGGGAGAPLGHAAGGRRDSNTSAASSRGPSEVRGQRYREYLEKKKVKTGEDASEEPAADV